jgi:predicted small metal-binding protein
MIHLIVEKGGDNMKTALKKLECDPVCGFMIRSHDEKELISIALEHAKKFHKEIKVTEKDVKAMIKAA